MTTCSTAIDQVQEDAQYAIRDVFSTMLSIDVSLQAPTALPHDVDGEVVSSVGFIGKVTGAVYLYCTVGFARVLTSRMLGIAEAEVDRGDMINDALGELSNMIVGSVKSRLCDRGATCTLTLPSIVRGQQLSVERPSQVSTRVIGMASGSHHFLAEIFVKEV